MENDYRVYSIGIEKPELINESDYKNLMHVLNGVHVVDPSESIMSKYQSAIPRLKCEDGRIFIIANIVKVLPL